MSVRGTGRWIARWVLLAGTALHVGTLPAQAPPHDSVSVYLFTAGQGTEVWERFGHNAIGVRGPNVPGGDLLFNWGLFDFATPGFVGRFIKGDMVYWMGASESSRDLPLYESRNREIVIQELNLTATQRDSLLVFLRWNARDENKYYHYDYFRDNCSTRVRDALDRVLGGALQRATDTLVTDQTYREMALRLMAGLPLLATGIDIGLGRPTDRRITAWEEMFIPMRLRDRIRNLQVPDESGRMIPLVRAERLVFKAERPAEPAKAPHHNVLFLVVGLVVAAAMLLVARGPRAPSAAARTLVTAWCLGVGTLGCLLAFLWLGTRHVYAYENMNLLQYNPLWLFVGALTPFVRKPSAARVATLLALLAAALTILALVLAIIPAAGQDSLDVLLLVAPANIAAAIAMRRMSAVATPRVSAP